MHILILPLLSFLRLIRRILLLRLIRRIILIIRILVIRFLPILRLLIPRLYRVPVGSIDGRRYDPGR